MAVNTDGPFVQRLNGYACIRPKFMTSTKKFCTFSNVTSIADSSGALQSPKACAGLFAHFGDSATSVSPPQSTDVCCILLDTWSHRSARECGS
jgi:hypothetical protein